MAVVDLKVIVSCDKCKAEQKLDLEPGETQFDLRLIRALDEFSWRAKYFRGIGIEIICDECWRKEKDGER